ncbi:MAG: DNA polymerase [Flavobacteriales bacterium]
MMTSDKDYGQLVSENIFIYRPGRGGAEADVLGIPEVCEKFGVERVEQVIDILGMMGDAVDNIPGLPGVGEKTAVKFIQEYGSLEGLLANTDKLKGKQKENVENNKELGLLSKKLATIILDVPVAFEEDAMLVKSPDAEKIKTVFEELEFRTLIKRVIGDGGAAADPVQGDLFSSEEPSTPIANYRTIADTEHHYRLVSTEEDLHALIQELHAAPVFCFDTETTDIEPVRALLVGLSFSTAPHQGWYVPVPTDLEKGTTYLNVFRALFEDTSKTLVAQNCKFDLKMLVKYGVQVKCRVFDTMIAHYLINPDGKHGMDDLSKSYLNYAPISIEQLIGKKGAKQGSMSDLKPEEISDYAAEDADVTLQLMHQFAPKLQDGRLQEVYDHIEMPLVSVLAEMETTGVHIDEPFLKAYSDTLQQEIQQLEAEICDLAGEKFNVDSPKQLGVILFEKMKITKEVKKTKTGQYSTDESTLAKFEHLHPIIAKVLDFRELRKLKSTYVDALPDMVPPFACNWCERDWIPVAPYQARHPRKWI